MRTLSRGMAVALAAALVPLIPAASAAAAPPTPRQIAYLTAPESLTVFDVAANIPIKSIPGFSAPHSVAVTPDGAHAYVTNSGAPVVSVISTVTNTVTGTITGLTAPQSAAVAPDGRHVYVTYGSNTVAVIDTATNTVSATIPVGVDPRGIAVTPDGRHVYEIGLLGAVSVIDTASNTVSATITTSRASGDLAMAPDGRRVYVSNGPANTVSVIDTASNTVTATIGVDRSPAGLAVTPDGTHVYVACVLAGRVSVIDTATGAVTSILINGSPTSVGISPDGRTVDVATGHLIAIDTATNQVVADVLTTATGVGGYATAVPTPPTARLALGVLHAAVTVDASGSTPGLFPIALYSFDFGDGTSVVGLQSPTFTHVYTNPGLYTVTVTVTDQLGLSASTTALASMSDPVVDTVSVLAASNNAYVSAEAAGQQNLRSNRAEAGAWEQFDVIGAGPGTVALRARINGRYVTASPAVGVLAASTTIGETELFQVTLNADGSISFLARGTNQYLSGNNGGASLSADRSAIGPWEEFYFSHPSEFLRAGVNGRYVTADNAGASPLIANRTAIGAWEQFDLIDAGLGRVALRAHANDRFVTADNAGASPLIANRTAIGEWERFRIVDNHDGSLSLQAGVNSRYVTADNAGASPLIANRTAIGPWERFDGLQWFPG